jgi:hypothetical protein
MPNLSAPTWATPPGDRPHPGQRATVRLHGLLALLLALAVAAMVVLADRLIHRWDDGHLFLAWVAMWVVIFAATAWFDSWSRCRAPARRSPLPTAMARPGAPPDGHYDGGLLPHR